MNDNDLERQLRTQAGPREHGYQPTPIPADLSRDSRRSRMGSTGRVALVGATVLAAAALAIVVTRLPQGAQSGVGSGGSVVASPSPQPTSTAPQTVACTAEDFAWSTDPWDAAAGSRGTTVLLRGVTSLDGCRIDGTVSVEIRDADGGTLVSGMAMSRQAATAGDVFQIGIAWSNWCAGEPAQPLSAVLKLPGDSTEVPLISSGGDILVPPCNGEAQPTNLSVTEIQPSERTFPEG